MAALAPSAYVELQCASHFSFLRGVSSCDELFARAKALGMEALAITDRNSLAGIVRALVAARATGVRLIMGCRLDLMDGNAMLVYPTDRASYARLSRLLSLGKSRAGKGNCHIDWNDVEDFSDGLIAIYLPGDPDDQCGLNLKRFKSIFAERAYVALTLRRRQGDYLRLLSLSNLAARVRVPTVVTNDVLYAEHDQAILQDVVTCIRHRCTIDDLGDRRELYADRYLKSPEEMGRLFPDYTEALRRSVDIADRCRFSMEELTYQYPAELTDDGLTPIERLKRLSWEGAKWRFPEGVPDEIIRLLKHELGLIADLNYAPYFLTVNAIVQYARSIGVLCQGRGSAANSCVCYVLGITSIDPARNDLLFERFISAERGEPPDIDVDFEHNKRELVMQWVFETYGRNHAALCSVVTRYRTRGALRDVARALGLPEDLIKTLSSQVSHWSRDGFKAEDAVGLGINLNDRRIRLVIELSRQLMGAPRHLSQHPGGFVLTHDRLDEMCPIEPAAMVNRQVIEFDKDDIEVLKWMKVDCLALGMMSAMRRGLDLLRQHKDIDLNLATIPAEDPRTYAMIRRADTMGTFQIESRAQMSMLPRIKPRTFYDLVVEVAIVRPGPIQGDMVHPYLRRREGKEPVSYPSPALEAVLSKTLGVPLFQEQAMRVVMVAAGFSAAKADLVRRAMATFKHTGGVHHFRDEIIEGMLKNGYTQEYAEQLFGQLQGFGSYGFPESHAASFALIAYASSWLKCHHPDVFLAALLDSQPMGFYAAAQLIRNAAEHGVDVRPVCANNSRWDSTLEPTPHPNRFAVRMGFRMIKGLKNADMATLIAARGETPFKSLQDLWRRSGVPISTLQTLGRADAFKPCFKLARREALFALKGMRDEPLPLFADFFDNDGGHQAEAIEPALQLKAMTAGHEVVEDYNTQGFSLSQHPIYFLRGELSTRGLMSCKEAVSAPDGKYVKVAGLVLVRQRPGSANGVTFMTIEDETTDLNVIVWEKTGQLFRRVLLASSLIEVSGQIQKEGEVIHLIARSLNDLTPLLSTISQRDIAMTMPHQPGDEFRNGGVLMDARVAKSPAGAALVKSRDFR
ncbi:error-prone DNA polymerase [Asticcacaulis sp. ZE23SCel15]|uniref:error-prone DNA polymerase n=1 Tax=Asticcacaulis sp. ZE23SCel15 TaxID=3059027 RepID=UPI002660112C|nr:error-prone DNA polymerase [Asticcacaulis sp. ZE23SCel15]WKL56545.1 error-prone DNA polymerase [Asticcacaulis sp. ZE23SCel15]